MAITSASNFSGGNAFEWGTAGTDAFTRPHVSAVASALDVHTHASGLGLPVTRLGTVTAVTSITAAVPITVAALALTVTNSADGASSQVAILQGDRATMAANDEAYVSLRLSDSAGNQDEFARLTWVGTTVTSTSEAGQLRFGVVVAGSLTDTLRLSGTVLSPSANDGLALGTTTLGFADLHIATGGVINWANGEITITETDANTLTIAGASTLIDVAAGIVELNNAVRFDTGVAMVAASYSVGRDADATNQLHFNVPTGATFEWSVNDVAQMTLSASTLGLPASGSVISFNSGDVTLTHSANTLAFAGGTSYTFDQALTVSAGGITVTGNSTFSNGTDASTTLTVGQGGAATASRTVSITLDGPSATAPNEGEQHFLISLNGTPKWQWGMNNAVAGAKGAASDWYLMDRGSGAYRMALTTAGALTTAAGITVQSGNSYLGDSANANMTLGLTINQGAADNEILALKSSDVGHLMTSHTEADTYGFISKWLAISGGLLIDGYSDADTAATTNVALVLRGNLGVTVGDTTKSTAAVGAVAIIGRVQANPLAQGMGANENILVVQNSATTQFILDADGDSHQNVGTAWTNFDAHDDLALLTDLSVAVSREGDAIRRVFGQVLATRKRELETLKLVSFNDTPGQDGHAFVNMSKLQMLTVGAVRQLYQHLEERTHQLTAALARLETVERRLALLPGGVAWSTTAR